MPYSDPSTFSSAEFHSNKKKRPSNLNLTSQNFFFISSIHSPKTPSPLIPCDTPELRDFLAPLSLDKIEKILTYNANPIKKSPNGVVNSVSLFLPTKNITQKLVKKQGGSGVQREIMITTAIRANTATKFPYHLFALPIHQQSNGVTNILFTNYRKLGDLETNINYIQQKIKLADNSALNYLFNIFRQLTIALDALHNSKFKDEEGNLRRGIVHNDIKPDNIFLKDNGDIELADFGCSYFKDSAMPQLATFLFSAPELWGNIDSNKKHIEKSDVWSLGATLIYVLNKELIAPSENLHNEFDKIHNYESWAKNYDQQWIKRVTKLGFISSKNPQLIINELQEKIKIISSNTLDINHKKILFEILAFLMLAPINVRSDVKKITHIMDTFDFIFDEEPRKFVSQLLERKCNVNTINSQPKNGYVSISDLNTKKSRFF